MAKNNRELKYDKQMLVLTSANDHDFIKQVAEQNKITMAEVIRKLIADLKKREEVNLNELAV